ncbi:MAG TPA: roadblock/LC7 domain-containing protein [Streptosporangiaceae bacterium]
MSRSADDRVRAELRLIRESVAGVDGSLVATNDGFLIAHDLPDIEPTAVAALAATTRSLASRTTESTGRGRFREAISRGSHGYLVVYAAGRSTLLAVVGTTDLNIGMLHYQTREIAERIATYAAQFGTGPAPAPAAPAVIGGAPGHGGVPGRDGVPARRPAPLPVRRKAAG